MASVNPYLGFNDECGPAFDFYKSVFGGEFTTKMKFSEVPASDRMPGQLSSEDEKIMHVTLPIGKGTVLMGSDRPQAFGKGAMGDAFNVSIGAESKTEADKLYNGLVAGGKMTVPMADAFWGSYFGMLTDKFGVQWMVSFDSKAAG